MRSESERENSEDSLHEGLAIIEVSGRQAPAADADVQEAAEDGAPAFARGDLVEVRRYGRGVVEEASATQVTVAFADRSRRSFLPEYVRRATARRRTTAAPERRAT